MNKIPQYLASKKGFYLNPECPEHHLRFSPDATAEEIRKVRIPVRLFSAAKEVMPNSKTFPEWIEKAGVKRL